MEDIGVWGGSSFNINRNSVPPSSFSLTFSPSKPNLCLVSFLASYKPFLFPPTISLANQISLCVLSSRVSFSHLFVPKVLGPKNLDDLLPAS